MLGICRYRSTHPGLYTELQSQVAHHIQPFFDMASLETTHNQPSGLLGLPQELFEEILDLLSTSDAMRLLLTNGRLFNDNYPRVYRAFLNRHPDNRHFLWRWAALRGQTKIINFAFDEEELDVNSFIHPCEHRFSDPAPNLQVEPDLAHSLTLLHLSIIGRQPELSRWLLEEKGADALITSMAGTAITTAIKHGSELSMQLASLWQKECYTEVASFYHAIQLGSIDLVRCLCSRGADVNDDKGNSGSPLITAVQNGSHEVARLLLALGANPNGAVMTQPVPRQFRLRKINPMVAAAMTGDEEMVRLLVNSGADVNRAIDGAEMLTPLCMAVQNNSPAAARLLLKFGALPDLTASPLTWTPYGLALQKCQHVRHPGADMLDLLISYDADPNRRQWNQPPAIFLLLQLGVSKPSTREIFHRALEHGVDVKEAFPHELYYQWGLADKQFENIRWTALHHCLRYPRHTSKDSDPSDDERWKQSLVGTLLDCGADPLAGYQVPADLPKTPLGFFLQNMVTALRNNGHKRLYESELDAMLSFVSHPRGGQSTAAFPVDVVAQLVGIVALLPLTSCKSFGQYRKSRVEKFAQATCVGERGVDGEDSWLATLLRSPGYWYIWDVCGRDSDVFQCLREVSGELAMDHWEKICPSSPTNPAQLMNGKRQLEDEESEQGPWNMKRSR